MLNPLKIYGTSATNPSSREAKSKLTPDSIDLR
jgi:hypothetical protein